MTRKIRLLLGALFALGCLLVAAGAWAAESLTVTEAFTPDRLGAPTNLSIAAQFSSTTGGLPSPISRLTLYAPAGLGIDANGAGTCNEAALRQHGPSGCPVTSRVGFGGGVGVIELPKQTIRERFTIDFFFAPREHGRLALLAYASAVAPVLVEITVIAKQVPAPAPYGLGFSVEIPPISTIPGATLASVESAFATFGSPDVAYYENVHGKHRLVHLRGVVVPKRCPAGGFPTQGTIDFADGSTLTVNPTIPCPNS